MPVRKQVQKPAPQEKVEEVVEPVKTEAEILEETNNLLDEIDELLIENAQEFVASYVQKGGE